jgi:hypothetical protein
LLPWLACLALLPFPPWLPLLPGLEVVFEASFLIPYSRIPALPLPSFFFFFEV